MYTSAIRASLYEFQLEILYLFVVVVVASPFAVLDILFIKLDENIQVNAINNSEFIYTRKSSEQNYMKIPRARSFSRPLSLNLPSKFGITCCCCCCWCYRQHVGIRCYCSFLHEMMAYDVRRMWYVPIRFCHRRLIEIDEPLRVAQNVFKGK